MTMGKNGDWWKGSFPTWIVALLLAILAYFFQRELERNDECRREMERMVVGLKMDVVGLQTRIEWLEETTVENHKILDALAKQLNVKNGL